MTDKKLKSWIEVDKDSDFSIYNMPFGIYSDHHVKHRACSAIGDYIIDLYELVNNRFIVLDKTILEQPFLNDFIGLGKKNTNAFRQKLIDLLCDEACEMKNKEIFDKIFKKQSSVKMLMPV